MNTNTSRRQVWSWAFYDWANSAYSTTIMAGFFPLFFKQYWSSGTESTLTTARLGTLISIGSLVIAVLSPFLGAMTDLRGSKKLFTFIFMLIGAVSSGLLALVPQGAWLSAALLYGVAMIGFNGSCNFYDSLLPSIAPGEKANYASSLGYGLGYLGGGVLFTINVAMFLNPELFGLSGPAAAVQASFVTVGVWWLVFSIPLFKNVPEPNGGPPTPWSETFRLSIKFLSQTALAIRKDRNLLVFIVAYWLYIDGVYTVMNMAVDFGASLGLESKHLIAALLLVQFVGFPFALLFSKFASMYGSKKPILICLAAYALALVFAVQMTTSWHFYALAILIGMVQGGVQALSRSFFSQMIPEQKSGEYFGFFNLVGKFASIMGPLVVGWGTLLFHDHRKGLLGLLVLFGIGGFLLLQVKEPTKLTNPTKS